MAGICTDSFRKGGPGCDHRTVTVDLDGTTVTVHVGEADLDAAAWGDSEKQQFVLWGLKRLRVQGLALDDAIGRVVNGEEATNVKQYSLLTRDVTKTNIGSAYANVPPGLNGERSLVEFTGCTEFRLVVHVSHVTAAAGQLQFRVVRDADSAVLYESPLVSAAAGEKELDTDWMTLPAAASGLALVRVQARSTVAADDPTIRRVLLLVR